MSPKSNFHQITEKFFQPPTNQLFIKKFFRPLIKHPFYTVITSVIIGIAFFRCVDLPELIRQNTDDILMLSSEIIIELGPNLPEESKRHAEMVKQYSRHLEQRQLAGIVRVLYPQYSPKKTLTSLSSDLEKAAEGTEEEAKKAIWKAGLTSNQLYKLCKRFPRSFYKWFKTEKLPDWLLEDLNKALAESTLMLNKLEKERTPEAAVDSCRANRKAILLLFLARLGYDNEEKIKYFKEEVERARDCTRKLAQENTEDKKKHEWLSNVAKSEDRRVNILGAMLDKDMKTVRKLLTEAIKEALEKEKGKGGN